MKSQPRESSEWLFFKALTCTDHHKHKHLSDKIYILLKVCWLLDHVKTCTCSPLDKRHEGNIFKEKEREGNVIQV